MAESIGIGWRNESESGGAFNRNPVADCVGIRNQGRDTALSSFTFYDFNFFFFQSVQLQHSPFPSKPAAFQTCGVSLQRAI
jgi:hypothetical protein